MILFAAVTMRIGFVLINSTVGLIKENITWTYVLQYEISSGFPRQG